MLTLILIFGLILINGYFSATEIAIVSSKKFKLQEEADKGNKNAKQILEYAKDPAQYLSTIQVGLTLIGLIEGLYGGVVFETYLEPKFLSWGMSAWWAHAGSILVGIGFITYVSIIIGELIPKSLALRQPQKLALRVVPSFRIFTFLAYPFVKILTASTRVILKLIHPDKPENQNLTDSDLKSLLSQAYRQGTLEKEELKLHENIFNFYDQQVESIMTPLQRVISIHIDLSGDKVEEIIKNSPHNYFPVIESNNHLAGFLSAKDYFMHRDKSLRDQTKSACTLKKNQRTSELLKKFQERNQNFGIVIDDGGSLFGLVTMHDIGESLLGKIP
jgi:putative hemolysin